MKMRNVPNQRRAPRPYIKSASKLTLNSEENSTGAAAEILSALVGFLIDHGFKRRQPQRAMKRSLVEEIKIEERIGTSSEKGSGSHS